MTLVGHVTYMEENRYAYRVLVEKTAGKIHFVRPGHRWDDNIKLSFRK
jgi:hypothetical protein